MVLSNIPPIKPSQSFDLRAQSFDLRGFFLLRIDKNH
nr:MAG TPA: hypothetical protein [Caudoviricetes sp.]